jgi:hypothetical protein
VNLVLASELTHKTLWYPTILGVLVVVAGVVLFMGSIYLLLGTNLGARLGFLVAFTGFAGFMVILTLLWCTTASPLNTLKGRIPSWKIDEVVTNLTDAKNPDVRNIDTRQNKVDTTELSNVKAAVDEALVTQVETPTEPLAEGANKFAEFAEVSDYQVLAVYEVGGSDPQFWKLQLTHEPLVAVAQFCQVQPPPPDRPFGLPPLPPECDTAEGANSGYVVLHRDLGSLRVPPFVALGMSVILFGVGLLALHWRERDEMEAEAARSRPTPVRVPEKV